MKTIFQNNLLMSKSIPEILAETRASRGLNKSQMAAELGIASQQYGQYESGKVAPKSDFREIFEKKFSISLKTGEPINPVAPIKAQKKVPIVGEASAGTELDMTYTDLDNSSSDQYIDVGDLLKDSQFAFVVYGNSMTPAYPSGCVLGIRRNYDTFIQPGETYLLVTKSNRLFKRLYYNEEKTAFVCYSDNTMMNETGPRKGRYAYEPFEVKFEDVISIFDVVGMIKRNRNSMIMPRQTG